MSFASAQSNERDDTKSGHLETVMAVCLSARMRQITAHRCPGIDADNKKPAGHLELLRHVQLEPICDDIDSYHGVLQVTVCSKAVFINNANFTTRSSNFIT